MPSCIDPCPRSGFTFPVHTASANSTRQDLTGHLTHQHRVRQDVPGGQRPDAVQAAGRRGHNATAHRSRLTQNLPGCWNTQKPLDSLLVQGLRIRLPLQGTRVPPQAGEDSTCRGSAQPEHRRYCSCLR